MPSELVIDRNDYFSDEGYIVDLLSFASDAYDASFEFSEIAGFIGETLTLGGVVQYIIDVLNECEVESGDDGENLWTYRRSGDGHRVVRRRGGPPIKKPAVRHDRDFD